MLQQSSIGFRRWLSGALAAIGLLGFEGRSEAAPAEAGRGVAQPIAIAKMKSAVQSRDSIGLGSTDHRALIAEVLRQSDFAVRDGRASSADASESGISPLVLGATVTELFCESTDELHCSAAIQWELKERRTNRVVYRVTTRGRASGADGATLRPQLIRAALTSLMQRERFASAVRAGGGTSAVAVPAGFRECSVRALAMPAASQAVLSATVLVESGEGLGSGSIISPDGLVLTAAHVIEPGAPLSVQLMSGEVLPASLIRQDVGRDVALLRVKGSVPRACLGLRREPVNVGEEVFAIGSPLSKSLSFSLTRGIVSGFRSMDGVPLVQTDASVNPGNSGGPLVDAQGRLIAVVDFKVTGEVIQGLAFAVSVQAALDGLGVHGAASTDEVLAEPVKWKPRSPASGGVDDVSDPAQAGDAAERAQPPSEAAVTMRMVGGLAVLGGAIGVGTTWLLYEAGNDNMSQGGFDTLKAWNTASWVVTGLGAASIGVSFLVGGGGSSRPERPGAKPERPKRRSARVYGGLGPGSLWVGGEL